MHISKFWFMAKIQQLPDGALPWVWQLLMLKGEAMGPQSAIRCTSDLQDLCVLNFTWIPQAPSAPRWIRDYISEVSLCNHRDSVLKMKGERIQMFRNHSGDFFFFNLQVVYKFNTRNIASKESSLSNFEKFIFVIICGTVCQLLTYMQTKRARITHS